ncbi:MAG: GtrA family protein [Eubacteriales bacterium]|nr:GtrA family protein [Eubacteriales bacterium]MDD4327132.1 GtrA family protein [Eubacteriales bacterium]
MRNRTKIISWLDGHGDNKICSLLSSKYELVSYVFFGVLTTLVNLVVYTILESILGQSNWYLSNLPAIVLAILFAYVTNRSFVFESDGNFWFEMLKFFGARIFVSLIFEYGAIYLLYDVMEFDSRLDLIVFSISWFKIISMLLVLVANYIASKIFVFKKTVEQESGEPQ